MSKNIVVVSNNQGKIVEFKNILKDFNVYSLKDLNIDIDVEETGLTFEENAILKVNALKDEYDYVIADDSGLEIVALDNQPGIYSHRFLGEDTPYSEKNPLVLDLMKDKTDRRAKFTSVIALAEFGEVKLFKGIIEGEISEAMAGTNGFGYNPIFYIPEYKQTMAEISDEIKNQVSHRALAIKQLEEYLLSE
ncbi:MAG: RdgB/HAM1 family non-canonical purine NTP pyrophosphatase [Erysipelothrix sp.]|nr:RdgB/HAM1 family non-canonical purine NTP pyrophosphatase [Erysipelothrix sp.]